MLERIFIHILNMSYISSIVIVAILIARLFLKKMPKRFSYLLWAVALIRLVIPFTFESFISLIPVNPVPIPVDIGYAKTPQISTGISIIDAPVNQSLPAAELVASVNPMQIVIAIGTLIWVGVMLALLIHGVLSYFKLKRQMKGSIWEEDNIFRANNIQTPFVIGVINPRIYLPSQVLASERAYVLLHEQTHIKRLDHVFRVVSYLVVCLHWFNPLVWIAFYLSSKDMEMACDETVIAQMGNYVKKEYAQTLLNFTTHKVRLRMSPLAFGEGYTKDRIKNVLHFRQPRVYFIVAVLFVLLMVSIGLLANPIKQSTTDIRSYRTEYVGNNSAVGNIVSQLQFPEAFAYKSIALQTDEQPYGLTVILRQQSEETMATLDANSSMLFEMNACILFSLVENLDQIAFSVDEGTLKVKPVIYSREWAYEKTGINLWEMSASEMSFEEALLIIKERVY